MKRVLVTGASGFIGRHCLPALLAKGYEVHALSFKACQEQVPGLTWHRVDLLDVQQIVELAPNVQATHLLHFAWQAEPGKFRTSWENTLWVQASLELLRAFALHGGRRVVMAGTCAEYDWRYGYCSEKTTPLRPATLYGVCKQALQGILAAFCEQAGLTSAWGRIFHLYGPHESPQRLVASVVRSLLQDQVAHCTHGRQIRDYLYVQDVADAFVALLESEISGSLNIGSGRPITVRELVYEIGRLLNRQDLIQMDALPAPADEPRLLLADVGRLEEEVGWSQKYDLRAGLDLTVQWWREMLGRPE